MGDGHIGGGCLEKSGGRGGRGQTGCTHYAFRVPDLICEIGPGLQVLGLTFGVPGPRLGNRSKVSDFGFHQNFLSWVPFFGYAQKEMAEFTGPSSRAGGLK